MSSERLRLSSGREMCCSVGRVEIIFHQSILGSQVWGALVNIPNVLEKLQLDEVWQTFVMITERSDVCQPLDLSSNNPLDLSKTRQYDSTGMRWIDSQLKLRGEDWILSKLLSDWNDEEPTDRSGPWRYPITESDGETFTPQDDLNNHMERLSDSDSEGDESSLEGDLTWKGPSEDEELYVFPAKIQARRFYFHKLWSFPPGAGKPEITSGRSWSRYPDRVSDEVQEHGGEQPALLESVSDNGDLLELAALSEEERDLQKEEQISDIAEDTSMLLTEELSHVTFSTSILQQNTESDNDDLMIDLL